MSNFVPELFGGNMHAAAFVDDLCYVAHLWDDLIDKDKTRSDDDINKAFILVFINIPSNPFYRENFDVLHPVLFSGILGYLTANKLEATSDAHALEIAHGLRYSIANVISLAVSLTNAPDAAMEILPNMWKQFMPERIDAYLKEHRHENS